MHKARSVLIAAICLPLAFVAAARAQTQSTTNAGACADYRTADAEMNSIYNRVMREYKADASFTRNMRAAQRAWIVYRDAHVASLYPATNTRQAYGSVYAACRCTASAEATKKRTEELRRWIDGVAEGDVCAGSIKIRRDDDDGGGTAAGGVPEYERADSIFRRRWTLTRMEDRSFDADAPHIEFDVKQGRFSGSGGCNRIFGGYRVDATELRLTAIAGTKRACANPAAQAIETNFIRALGATTRFEISADVIRLYAADDNLLLVFKADAADTGAR